MTYFVIILAVLAGAFGFRYWWRYRARAERLSTPLSDHQCAMVEDKVPLVLKLPAELRSRLEGKINDFLHQVEFVGCNGLEVTEEMRLSIAAQACLLVVNSEAWYDLSTVLIYEDAFKSREQRSDGFVVTEREEVRIGESWANGPVILSWAHTIKGAADSDDGHNVVFHEFAHQLDDSSGRTNGAPMLGEGQSYAEWEQVFVEAYERHLRDVGNEAPTVLDAYGAKAPEEYFAVAVEAFFERPAALKRDEPAVYEQLSEFFRLDPVTWG
ncbi:MAG: M90 family metallopeptidase [Pseudomonadota bacterium]